MNTLTVPIGPDCIYEFYPYDAIEGVEGEFPRVEQLHVEGGKLEVAADWPVNDELQRVTLMTALGASMPEISGQLDNAAKWHHRLSLQNLDAENADHEVTRLFQLGLLRVIDPIGLPELTPKQQTYIRELADGKTLDKIAATFGTNANAVRQIAKKVYAKMETSSSPRAVLLGYLGGLLCGKCDMECGPTILEDFDASVSPHTVLDSPKESAGSIDYVRWGEGTFSFSQDSPLTPTQQGIVALSAIGMSRPESAIALGEGLNPLQSRAREAQEKLEAKNIPHTITQALRTKAIRITREIEPLDITKRERMMLSLAAEGATFEQTADAMDTPVSIVRTKRSEMLRRIGTNSITAAVMKAYMSGDLPQSSPTTGTSAA